jgi:DNA-binding XRE family transcriptional regulator
MPVLHGPYARSQSPPVGVRFIRTDDWHVPSWELAFLLTIRAMALGEIMYELSQVLERNLASLTTRARVNRRSRAFARDRTLQLLVADLVAARPAAGMTQQEVACRMWTTKSAICRLESGVCTRPTLSTIEKYVLAVGARVEIHVRTRR